MNKIQQIYIPYLQTGYSEDTVEDLLCDLAIYSLDDCQKISKKALQTLEETNQAIQVKNANRHFIIKVLDTLLWALTFGFVRILEKELKINQLMATASKIELFVAEKPLIDQKNRKDYPELKKKYEEQQAAKRAAIEKLQGELVAKEAEKKAAVEKLEQEKKIHEVAMQEIEQKVKLALPAKKAELQAAAEKAKQEFQVKQSVWQAEIDQKEAEELKITKDLKDFRKTDEQKKIKALKDQWLDDLPSEIKRLEAKNLFSSVANSAIQQSAGGYWGGANQKADQVKKMVGRVLEIKQLYSPTHYVFTHAQASGLSVIQECMKGLLKDFVPEYYHPLSVPFRMPHSIDHTENVQAFIKKHPEVASGGFNDDQFNAKTGSELLSVDTYVWNTATYESALYFLSSGTNINEQGNSNIGLDIFKTIFINYLQDNFLCEILAKKAHQIAVDKKKAAALGTLYAICIPKKVVENPETNFAYRAHAYGRKCNCHSEGNEIDVLQRLQRDEILTCWGGAHPQYRLLTSRLTEEQTVRIFPVSPFTKVQNKEFSKRIKNLIRELSFYSKIVNLREAPTKEETDSLKKELESLAALNLIEAECLEYLLTVKQEHIPKELKETWSFILGGMLLEEDFNYNQYK